MLADVTPPVPASLASLLAVFGPLFTAPSFRTFCGLACGFLAQTGKRTVCGMLAGAGLSRLWRTTGRTLEAALPKLRELTREPVDVFCQQMRALCADCGVAVVFVPELPGARASGVMRWLSPAKALIQLSLRYKTDDHLWFTFFHEIGHVLRHGKTDVWIEASSSSEADDPREAEADKFSRDMLIPPRDARELPALRSADQVRGFAERLGIAPGIVVGRLQHDGIWSHSRGNQLKRQLSFGAAGDDSLPCE